MVLTQLSQHLSCWLSFLVPLFSLSLDFAGWAGREAQAGIWGQWGPKGGQVAARDRGS